MSRRTMSARTPQAAPPAFDPVEMHRRNWPDTCDARLIGFAVALERAHALAARRLAAVAARHDLNPAEFDVLATLRRSGQPWQRTPSEIRTLVLLTSGGLTKVLRQLQARGLVTRSTSGLDRRSKPARLTARGRRVIEAAAVDIIAASGTHLRSALNDEEIDQLTVLLQRFAALT